MKSFKSGTQVEYGIYVSPKALDARFVGADNETLDGKRGATYFRLPTLLAIAAAPLLGALFVMTFPVIVIAMVGGALIKGAFSTVSSAVKEGAQLMNVQWQPTAAYLSGKKKQGNDSKKIEKDADMTKLEEEVQAKKQKE